jgi:uncharacterized tellurite resistance protein B-like protein
MGDLMWLLMLAAIAWIAWKLTSSKKNEQRAAAAEKAGYKVGQLVARVTVTADSGASVRGDSSSVSDDRDAWEGGFLEEASDPKRLDARLKIKYTDRDGSRTERVIRVREFDAAPGNAKSGLIFAHCEMRNANRSFRYERIQSAIDMETGELIPEVQSFLIKRWEASPNRSLEEFQDAFSDPLQLLMFVARADGRLVAKERAAILAFCRKHLPDTRVTDDDLVSFFKEGGYQSLHSFKVGVGRLLKSRPELVADIVSTADAIVAAEKTPHPSEVEALAYLKKRLSSSV